MHDFVERITAYIHWAIFLLLEVLSGLLLFKYNSYQGSIWFTQANTAAAYVHEWEAKAFAYLRMPAENAELVQRNILLQHETDSLRHLLAEALKDSSATEKKQNTLLQDIKLIPAHIVDNSVRNRDNLLDINAAVDLIDEFDETTFAILKHNNACGLASRDTLLAAWTDALAGDPVSAFGGVLITNRAIDKETAEEINKIFFEVIIAPDYDVNALEILTQKKNRIILVRKETEMPRQQYRSVLNGVLVQDRDLKTETAEDCKTATTKAPTAEEIEDMLFANKIVKNSKSNAIVLAKNKQLLASGVGQTSRVDALKHAIEKAQGFGFDLQGAVMASDAFFPFPDCVEIAHEAGVTAVIQPGGSVRDAESVEYCNNHDVAMVITGFRHFKH